MVASHMYNIDTVMSYETYEWLDDCCLVLDGIHCIRYIARRFS